MNVLSFHSLLGRFYSNSKGRNFTSTLLAETNFSIAEQGPYYYANLAVDLGFSFSLKLQFPESYIESSRKTSIQSHDVAGSDSGIYNNAVLGNNSSDATNQQEV